MDDERIEIMSLSRILGTLLLLSVFSWNVQAQTATVRWGTVYQTIDGFGAYANAANGEPISSAQAAIFFGTATGDIGLTLMRVPVTNGGGTPGSCLTVSTSCAGSGVSEMQAALAANSQVRIWASPWSPPSAYKTNGSTVCNTGTGAGSLIASDYASYATWLANYVKSLSSLYGINLYALSLQNEPDYCPTSYDGAVWTAANFDTFIKTNLGPTFATDGLTTLIMMPETSDFLNFESYASSTMADSAAAAFVSINAWHDYDATWNPPNSVANPYASQGKRYWETEASAGKGFGPSLMGGAWDPSMADALLWAAIIDNRIAVANASAWNWWAMIGGAGDNEPLIGGPNGTQIAQRAYVIGNYSLFVRPGYNRIDATHVPQSGVTVSAYKNQSTGALVIIATNYNSSSVSQIFSLSGATISTMTPWTTSANLNLIQQSGISVSGDSFSYTLPAESVTTFVGVAGGMVPSPPADLKATVQ
jgi:glucuronoarabinoxylan endo-1,4-beta-xylanase